MEIKKFYVEDGFRLNPKSLVPGGYDLEIEFYNGDVRVYSNIKSPEAYAASVTFNDPSIKSITVIGKSKKD